VTARSSYTKLKTPSTSAQARKVLTLYKKIEAPG